MEVLAKIQSYPDLAVALATHRKRSGRSLESVEKRTGLPQRYIRRLEAQSMYPGANLERWLDSLGVVLVLVQRAKDETSKLPDLPNSPNAYEKVRKKVAAKGGRLRLANLSDVRKRQRAREIARIAGRARQMKLRKERRRQSRIAPELLIEPRHSQPTCPAPSSTRPCAAASVEQHSPKTRPLRSTPSAAKAARASDLSEQASPA